MEFDGCEGLTAADCHGDANADGPVNLNSCGLGAVAAGRAFAAATASPGGRRVMSKVRGTMLANIPDVALRKSLEHLQATSRLDV
jgi:hypothetical protein